MPELNDHSIRRHALLSASGAARWMNCPPSALYTANIPDKQTPFAAEGSEAHEIAEAYLNAYLDGKPQPKFKGHDKELADAVYPYVEHCISIYEDTKKKHADAVMFIETKVNFSKWVPEGFGTADCIIIAGNVLIVRDLKFGKGVPVSAIENPQARCYGLGALAEFEDLYDIDTVINQIDQVRLEDGLSEEVISVADLLKWADEELKPKAELAIKGEGEFKAGAWCQFCKANATCPYRFKRAQEVVAVKDKVTDIRSLNDAQLNLILSRKADIVKWLKAVEDYATERAMNNDLPGWKMVAGRSNRAYTDEADVAAKLKEAGYDDALIYDRKLIGITAMTKLLGGKKKFDEILGNYVYKPEGKPTLVPESDKRPALTDAAQSDFDVIDIEDEKEKK